MDPKQKQMLRAGLQTAFATYAGFKQFLEDNFGFDLNQHTDAGAGLQVAYSIVIADALANGWSDHLLQACVAHTNPGLSTVAATIAKQLTKSRPIFFEQLRTDPFGALFLGEEECFIGRDGLRAALRGMESGTGRRRVLVVNGSPSCGKTYTYGLLRLLDRLGEGHVVVKVDFREFREGDLESRYRDIIEQINVRMEVPSSAMPQLHESQTRWFQNAMRKFDTVARGAGKKLWLVFDHIGLSEEEDKVADALASAAIFALDDASALQVVLIDMDPSRLKLEPQIRTKLRSDQAALPVRDDLVNFLQQARALSKRTDVQDEHIEREVTDIVQALTACDESQRAYELSPLAWRSASKLGLVS
jgi:hypothetical protein